MIVATATAGLVGDVGPTAPPVSGSCILGIGRVTAVVLVVGQLCAAQLPAVDGTLVRQNRLPSAAGCGVQRAARSNDPAT
ncbi:hypothetical protein B1987_07635 [Mycobacterium kansasii]|nr:hypothetical protein B1987_07635 [Mycobacterium kansasii]